MAFGTQTAAFVMAKAAFQGLVTGAIKFAAIVFEEGTFVLSKLIGRDRSFTALEGWRQHAEGQLRCNLQHHAVVVACLEGKSCLLYRPPAGTCAIAQANVTGTGLGGWILLRQGFLVSRFSFCHLCCFPSILQTASSAAYGFPRQQLGWAKESRKHRSGTRSQS